MSLFLFYCFGCITKRLLPASSFHSFCQLLAPERSWHFFFLLVMTTAARLCLETRGNLPKQMVTLLASAEVGTQTTGWCCSSTEIQGFRWHLDCGGSWKHKEKWNMDREHKFKYISISQSKSFSRGGKGPRSLCLWAVQLIDYGWKNKLDIIVQGVIFITMFIALLPGDYIWHILALNKLKQYLQLYFSLISFRHRTALEVAVK